MATPEGSVNFIHDLEIQRLMDLHRGSPYQMIRGAVQIATSRAIEAATAPVESLKASHNAVINALTTSHQTTTRELQDRHAAEAAAHATTRDMLSATQENLIAATARAESSEALVRQAREKGFRP